MKTSLKTSSARTAKRSVSAKRFYQWTAFAAALCSMLALVSVLTGAYQVKLAGAYPVNPTTNSAEYYASTVDMSQIFRAH